MTAISFRLYDPDGSIRGIKTLTLENPDPHPAALARIARGWIDALGCIYADDCRLTYAVNSGPEVNVKIGEQTAADRRQPAPKAEQPGVPVSKVTAPEQMRVVPVQQRPQKG